MEGWSRVRLRSHKQCCSVSPVTFGLSDMITLVSWNSDVDKSPMGVEKIIHTVVRVIYYFSSLVAVSCAYLPISRGFLCLRFW